MGGLTIIWKIDYFDQTLRQPSADRCQLPGHPSGYDHHAGGRTLSESIRTMAPCEGAISLLLIAHCSLLIALCRLPRLPVELHWSAVGRMDWRTLLCDLAEYDTDN
ncbi:hypothetical protein [Mesorhizobium australicum]|uniref:hypothetical protein n=1 Tax=Mesorhizobium australicum TaxID=536018 RepID=UPI00333DAAB4